VCAKRDSTSGGCPYGSPRITSDSERETHRKCDRAAPFIPRVAQGRNRGSERQTSEFEIAKSFECVGFEVGDLLATDCLDVLMIFPFRRKCESRRALGSRTLRTA